MAIMLIFIPLHSLSVMLCGVMSSSWTVLDWV